MARNNNTSNSPQSNTPPPQAPLGITPQDPSPANEEPKQQADAPQSNKPECPYCKVPCRSNRSEPYFTRYYCPQQGCGYSVKVPRPRMQERVAADRQAEQGGFSAR